MRIRNHGEKIILRGFRVMLFRMVPKRKFLVSVFGFRFRVMLFRMIPKLKRSIPIRSDCFRVMLFSFRKYDMIDVKISLICINMVII